MRSYHHKYYLSNTARTVIILLWLFWFSGGIYKWLARGMDIDFRIGLFVKAAVVVYIILWALIRRKIGQYNILFLMLILFLGFLIGQWSFSLHYPENHFKENLITFFKYMFLFVMYLLGMELLYDKGAQTELYRHFKKFFYMNGILALTGLLFGIKIFQTYDSKWRFGYDGLIYAQNEASYLYILTLFLVYYRMFYLKKDYIFGLFVILTSLIVGTKAVYAAIALLLIFYLLTQVRLKHLIVSAVVVMLTGGLFFKEKIGEVLLKLKTNYDYFYYFYQREGFWNALSSGRFKFIEQKFIPLVSQYWSPVNWIFGGQDVTKFYTEMSLTDLLLFFGIFGALVFLYGYTKIFNQFAYRGWFLLFFFFIFTGLALFTGHFFESGIAGFFFVVVLLVSRIELSSFNVLKNHVHEADS